MIENVVVSEGIEYILNHLWQNITLEEVADYCHMSVSRFSTIFKEQTGESVYAFIKRLKMEQSALRLKVEASKNITDIGETYGYSASNFSWAFSQYHKKTPSKFREDINLNQKETDKIIKELDEIIYYETKPDYEVMYERYIGSYDELKKRWCEFTEKYKDDIDGNTIFFERTFDDPTITDFNKCIYDICMTTRHISNYENSCVLKGGKFAVYPFKGFINEIFPIHQKLIGVWFPAKKLELDERYSYDQYHMVREDGYMEFDICIPIKD